MQIRRLEPREHILTRPLYEEVFSEDERAFVDYYYSWKTKDDVIYVAEDEQGIHAMVHLNPFSVRYQGKIQKLHYIVAVATQEKYRHQGLMRRLLAQAEQDMRKNGEPLTFLMPASEKIYEPFGYRFFGWQRRGMLRAVEDISVQEPEGMFKLEQSATRETIVLQGTERKGATISEKLPETASSGILENASEIAAPGTLGNVPETVGFGASGKRKDIICRPAYPEEYEALANWTNTILEKQYELYVVRDFSYYERLAAEQESQGGAVMVIISATEEEEILGTFCTAMEEDGTLVFREIILDPEHSMEAYQVLQSYAASLGQKEVRVEGCQRELPLQAAQEVPLFMGKVPGDGIFTELPQRETVFLNEVV